MGMTRMSCVCVKCACEFLPCLLRGGLCDWPEVVSSRQVIVSLRNWCEESLRFLNGEQIGRTVSVNIAEMLCAFTMCARGCLFCLLEGGLCGVCWLEIPGTSGVISSNFRDAFARTVGDSQYEVG